MAFQGTVKRQYTTGWAGEIVRDGPNRTKVARISSQTLDGSGNTNRISRAFGYTADMAATGTTTSNLEITVGVGALPFAGVLVNPKHYALQGNAYGTNGTLAPSMDLQQYTEAEFMEMGIIVGELFNETTATKNTAYGDGICYVTTATTGAQNLQGLPLGALVSFSGANPPAGFTAIPGARVINTLSLSASASGNVVSGLTTIQLTQ